MDLLLTTNTKSMVNQSKTRNLLPLFLFGTSIIAWVLYTIIGHEFNYSNLFEIQNYLLLISISTPVIATFAIYLWDGYIYLPLEQIFFMVFLLIAIFSILFSNSPFLSLWNLKFQPIFLIIMLGVANMKVEIRHVVNFLIALFYTNMFILIWVFLFKQEPIFAINSIGQNLNGHIVLLAGTFPFLLHRIYQTDSLYKRRFYLIGGSLFLLIPIFYQSRISVIFIFWTIIIASLLGPKQSNWKIPVHTLLSIIIILTMTQLLFFIVSNSGTRMIDSTITLFLDTGQNLRGDIYISTLNELKNVDVYLHGMGYEAFQLYYNTPPHNVFIKTLLETGIAGFLAFLSFTIITATRSLRQIFHSKEHLSSIQLSTFISLTNVYIFYLFEPQMNAQFFFFLAGLPFYIQYSSKIFPKNR